MLTLTWETILKRKSQAEIWKGKHSRVPPRPPPGSREESRGQGGRSQRGVPNGAAQDREPPFCLMHPNQKVRVTSSVNGALQQLRTGRRRRQGQVLLCVSWVFGPPRLHWRVSFLHNTGWEFPAHPQQLMGGSLTQLALKQVLSSDTLHLLAARLGRTSPSCSHETERDSSFRGF